MAKLYWLSEAEFARIEPLLPRGRRGASSHRPSRRIRFDRLHRLCDRQPRRKIAQDMYMISCAIDNERLSLQIPDDAGHVRHHLFLKLPLQPRLAILRAENDVIEKTGVSLGHEFVSPLRGSNTETRFVFFRRTHVRRWDSAAPAGRSLA